MNEQYRFVLTCGRG